MTVARSLGLEAAIRLRNKLDPMHLLNAATVESNGLPGEQLAVSLSDVLAVQHALSMLGFDSGPQDGGDGAWTQAGVRAFQQSQGLEQNGGWGDPDTRTALTTALTDPGWLVV